MSTAIQREALFAVVLQIYLFLFYFYDYFGPFIRAQIPRHLNNADSNLCSMPQLVMCVGPMLCVVHQHKHTMHQPRPLSMASLLRRFISTTSSAPGNYVYFKSRLEDMMQQVVIIRIFLYERRLRKSLVYALVYAL